MSVPPKKNDDAYITTRALVRMMQDAFDAELARLPLDLRYPKDRAIALLAENGIVNVPHTINELHSLGELYDKVLKAREHYQYQVAELEKSKTLEARLGEDVALQLKLEEEEEAMYQDSMRDEEEEEGHELEHEDLSTE